MIEYGAVPAAADQFVEKPSVLEEQDAGGIAGAVGVVGDHENGSVHGPVHLRHDLQQIFGRLGIQSAGGFVGQKQGLSRHHGAGAGGALLLPAGYLIGEFGQNIGDAQLLRHILHLLLYGRRLRVCQRESQTDVFFNGQRIEEVEVLKYEPQLLASETGQLGGRKSRDVDAVQTDPSGADCVDGGDAVEQRRLTAAGRSHYGDKLTVLHAETDSAQRLGDACAISVIFFDIFYLQHVLPPVLSVVFRLLLFVRPGCLRESDIVRRYIQYRETERRKVSNQYGFVLQFCKVSAVCLAGKVRVREVPFCSSEEICRSISSKAASLRHR